MASKPRSEYDKVRRQLREYAQRRIAQGLELDIERTTASPFAFPTEYQLRQQGMSTDYINQQIEYMQQVRAELEQAEALDIESGEVITPQEYYKELRREAGRRATQTRKQYKEAERRFWTQTEDNPPARGGVTVYMNLVQELFDRLEDVIPTRTPSGRRRRWADVEASANAQSKLKMLLNNAIATDGEDAVGWRLYDAFGGSDALSAALDAMTGGYTDDIMTQSYRIADAITGRTTTMGEMADLSSEAEMYESYEV